MRDVRLDRIMLIPLELVSTEALDNLIAEYCLRDWGLNDNECPLTARRSDVRQALDRGDLLVYFSESDNTARLIPAHRS
jgi:uncharacterized protein YheU (UPF0270 family)